MISTGGDTVVDRPLADAPDKQQLLVPMAPDQQMTMISRRRFLTAIVGSGAVIRSGVASDLKRESIDREALVRRHNPVLRQLDPLSPISLGNGEFAFYCRCHRTANAAAILRECNAALHDVVMGMAHNAAASRSRKGLRLTQYELTEGWLVIKPVLRDRQTFTTGYERTLIDSILVRSACA